MTNYRPAQIYLFMVFMMALASSTIFTTYSIYYVTELGLSPFELVLVGTVLEITVLLFEGITGVVADTYGRKRSIIIGVFILGAAFVLEGSIVWLPDAGSSFPVLFWVLAAQILFGIGWTFVSGADAAWIMDELEEGFAGELFMRAKRFSLAASLLGIGCSVGLSLLLPNLPYLAGGVIYLLLGLLLIRWMKETGFVPRARAARTSHFSDMGKTWMSGVSTVRQSPLLLLLVGVTLFSGAASEGVDRLWQIHLIDEVGFPDTVVPMAVWFGLISAMTTLLGMLGVWLAGKNIDMSREKKLSAVLFVLTFMRIGCILLLALAADFWWALLSVLAMGVVASVTDPVYSTWLNMKLESNNRATVLSMVSQSDALGQSAGGSAVGWIGSRYSIRASLLAAGLMLLPVLALFGRLIRK